MTYTLNHNPDGGDVLHVEYPHEACNTDEAEGLEKIDDETAAALIASTGAKACLHCNPAP